LPYLRQDDTRASGADGDHPGHNGLRYGRPQLHRSPHDHHTDTRRPAQRPGSL